MRSKTSPGGARLNGSMKLVLALLLATATIAFVPAASAHDCNGTSCGPCVKGETHNHNDMHGNCSSGPGFLTENGYGGSKTSPGTQVIGTFVALACVALALAFARGP